MTPQQIVDYIKRNFRERFPDGGIVSDAELDKSIRTRDDDPGEWCGQGGHAWLCFEHGIPSPYYDTLIDDWMHDAAPEGYFIELHNPAVAVVYDA